MKTNWNPLDDVRYIPSHGQFHTRLSGKFDIALFGIMFRPMLRKVRNFFGYTDTWLASQSGYSSIDVSPKLAYDALRSYMMSNGFMP